MKWLYIIESYCIIESIIGIIVVLSFSLPDEITSKSIELILGFILVPVLLFVGWKMYRNYSSLLSERNIGIIILSTSFFGSLLLKCHILLMIFDELSSTLFYTIIRYIEYALLFVLFIVFMLNIIISFDYVNEMINLIGKEEEKEDEFMWEV